MTATGQLSRITPYVARLLEDEYIQEQIGQAFDELRRSARRAKGRKASEALNDQQLRNQIRSAVGSLTNARRALDESPSDHDGSRRTFVLTAAALAAVLAWQRRS